MPVSFKSKTTDKDMGGDLIREVLLEASGSEVVVGLFEDDTYPDGTPVALVGMVNEFGAGSTPERSFIRRTVRERGRQLDKAHGEAIQDAALGKGNLKRNLIGFGKDASDEVRKTIDVVESPPNTQETLEAKGSDNPLVATKRMQNSVRAKVTIKNKEEMTPKGNN